jgi:hypothetical protein
VPGAEVVGIFPGDLAYSILLTAALQKRAQQPKVGRKLIEYLASSATAAVKRKRSAGR